MNAQQRAQWLSDRCGKLTASSMADAMDFLAKGGESSKRKNLKIEKVAERMTGLSVSHYVTPQMQWGLDKEPEAKQSFELATGKFITDCLLFDHPWIEYFSATPDGLIDDDAVIEFKCPETTTHIDWIAGGEVPAKHKPQILAQLACTGRTRAIFVSYDPRIRNPEKRLFIREWIPDRLEVEKVEAAAIQFLKEVDELFDLVNC